MRILSINGITNKDKVHPGFLLFSQASCIQVERTIGIASLDATYL